jgi:hypothetical protein
VKTVGGLGQRLGAIWHAEDARRIRRREDGEAVSQEFPELVDRVGRLVLQLPDLVVVRIVLVGADQMAKLPFEQLDAALVGPLIVAALARPDP